MILYFSGTGNSKDAAERVAAATNDKVYDIAMLLKEEMFELSLSENENIGFVFPVYFYTVPDIVSRYVEKLTIKQNSSNYGFVIVTCGGSSGDSGDRLARMLYKNGIRISLKRELLMPDNAMIYYNIPDEAEELKRLAESYIELDNIIYDIKNKVRKKIKKPIISNASTLLYNKVLSTKKFYSDDKCINCGKCALKCPEGAIELKDGKPIWIKDKCSKCLRCINACPSKAIQYGSKTKNRNRYVNPNVKL